MSGVDEKRPMEEGGVEVGLSENSVPTPTKPGASVTVQTQKSKLAWTALLGGSELKDNNVLGCDVTFDVTLGHSQDPLPHPPNLGVFMFPGSLPTRATVLSQSILFPQSLKFTP